MDKALSLIEEIIKVNCIHCTGASFYIDIFKILKARKLGCVSYEEIHDFTSLSIDRIIECSHYIKKEYIEDRFIFINETKPTLNIPNLLANSKYDRPTISV